MWWILSDHVRVPDGRTGVITDLSGDDATVRTDGDGELITVPAAELDLVTWP
jgi:hypothetical protein